MKRKILGVSALAWIIAIVTVLLFTLTIMFDIFFYIAIGIICFFFIYLIALLVENAIN